MDKIQATIFDTEPKENHEIKSIKIQKFPQT
uniref:Uncharacterized protein n=1 Tax=Rhizophora mucronata TaxID=61149 RepID=A0A2P2PRR1_RHIMU